MSSEAQDLVTRLSQDTDNPGVASLKLRVFLLGNRFRPGFLRQLVVYGLLIVLAALFVIPFYWMLNTALKPSNQVFSVPPTWFPKPVVWSNFYTAMTGRGHVEIEFSSAQPAMYRYFMNTTLITVNGVVATLLSSSMVAYAFARLEFPGKNPLFVLILSTLMIPFAVVMVPRFIVWKHLKWLNTFWPLMVPHWFGSAWNIFLLRQFFMTIPIEYDEAALIEGASRWDIYWRIMLPLAKPALAAVAVFAFVYFWNDFLEPLIILSTPENFTLTIYLVNFTVAFWRVTPWHLYMAGALIVILPCLMLFFFSQQAFLKGITVTGLK